MKIIFTNKNSILIAGLKEDFGEASFFLDE